MKIPLVTQLPPDGRIIKGPHAGQEHFYKTALYNTLLVLHPRVCLEIGTYKGGSTAIFERYFEEACPEGKLVTADIKLFVNVNSACTKQVQVYPHTMNVLDFHTATTDDLLPAWERVAQRVGSVEYNTIILKHALRDVGADAFDFAFIDGNHQAASLQRDIAMVQGLTAYPHYMLLDDAIEGAHESSAYCEDVLKKSYDYYDFSDWPILAGTLLIWTT